MISHTTPQERPAPRHSHTNKRCWKSDLNRPAFEVKGVERQAFL
jgi:hypothetical protein